MPLAENLILVQFAPKVAFIHQSHAKNRSRLKHLKNKYLRKDIFTVTRIKFHEISPTLMASYKDMEEKP